LRDGRKRYSRRSRALHTHCVGKMLAEFGTDTSTTIGEPINKPAMIVA
jgi:hypothetical protein